MTRLFAFVVALMFSNVALCRVASISLAQLLEESDLVALAKVDELSCGTARATVLETWKGSPRSTIEFLAIPTWTCDISTAEPGETIVLFLSMKGADTRAAQLRAEIDELAVALRDQEIATEDRQLADTIIEQLDQAADLLVRGNVYSIAHSGRGRMPVRLVMGVERVVVWTGDVRLPDTMTAISDATTDEPSILLSELKRSVIGPGNGQ